MDPADLAVVAAQGGQSRELVGVAEISERTGISRQNLSNLATRRALSHFPEPVQDLRMGPVYDWSEVKAWAEARGYPK